MYSFWTTFLVVSFLILSNFPAKCELENSAPPEGKINDVSTIPNTTVPTETSLEPINTSSTIETTSVSLPTQTAPVPPTTTISALIQGKCLRQASSEANKTYIENIVRGYEKNVDKIIELLRKHEAENCMHGCDPKLDDLCPDLTKARSYNSSIANLNDIRISDVRSRVIDEKIVDNLIEICPVGEWCLGENIINHQQIRVGNQTTTTDVSPMIASQKLFCLIDSCFKTVDYYSERCVDNDFDKHIVQLAPELCNFDIENTMNEFCVENSLRLMHVAAALYKLSEEVVKKTPDVCEEQLAKGKCSEECKRLALEINKHTSCCAETKLIKTFHTFNWYFGNYSRVRDACELPIKSICFSDGKYYVGISPKILVISIITSVVLTTLIVTINYLLCCRRSRRRSTKVYDESAADDICEYAHLNPSIDDDNISLNQASLGDEFGLRHDENRHMNKATSLNNVLMDTNSVDAEKVIFVDMNNNGNRSNISRFVNKHQTDIRSLFN